MKHKRVINGKYRKPGYNGMNWISQIKRLAIYLRDGLACCYCGHSCEQGAQLTLDHVRPARNGGGNKATNLATACDRCNRAKGKRTLLDFAYAVAEYVDHGVDAQAIIAHVELQMRKPLPMDEAKLLIAARGSAAKALAHLRVNGGAR